MEFNLTSLLLIGVAIFVVFYVIKFIVSPLLKLIAGIVAFVAIIFILVYFFHLDLIFVMDFLNKYLNFDKWTLGFNWVTNLLNKISSLFEYMKTKLPQSGN